MTKTSGTPATGKMIKFDISTDFLKKDLIPKYDDIIIVCEKPKVIVKRSWYNKDDEFPIVIQLDIGGLELEINAFALPRDKEGNFSKESINEQILQFLIRLELELNKEFLKKVA